VASALRELVQQKLPPSAMQTFQQQLGPLPPASDPQALSFWVAAYLPVSLAVRPSTARYGGMQSWFANGRSRSTRSCWR
jgi:hypothetical protein